jgi:hypothetical protein
MSESFGHDDVLVVRQGLKDAIRSAIEVGMAGDHRCIVAVSFHEDDEPCS